MTDGPGTEEFPARRERLLAEAVRLLTEAARLTRRELERAGPAWVDSGRRAPVDWAEFVALAVAGAAANVGGIDRILAGQPHSTEADRVRELLRATAGYYGERLPAYRTEPVVVDLDAAVAFAAAGGEEPYDQAFAELDRRRAGSAPDPALDDLELRLERQRRQDVVAFGRNVRMHVEAASTRVRGLAVPVVVTVRVPGDGPGPAAGPPLAEDGIADMLKVQAIAVAPLPGDGVPPLLRLEP